MPGSRIETRPMLTSSGTLPGGGDCVRSDATSITSIWQEVTCPDAQRLGQPEQVECRAVADPSFNSAHVTSTDVGLVR
jgi:hypothetical protein